jgi:flagellar basal-body rod protein FlgB
LIEQAACHAAPLKKQRRSTDISVDRAQFTGTFPAARGKPLPHARDRRHALHAPRPRLRPYRVFATHVARLLLVFPAGQVIDGASVAFNLDSYLGVHAPALKLREQRTELLARNLANADTPGYKARDLDFRAALASAEGTATPGAMQATQPGHIGTTSAAGLEPGSTEAFLKYRTPLAPSLDGNTVDAQLEQAAFADNAVRYQATLSFLSSKFRSLMTAITGE